MPSHDRITEYADTVCRQIRWKKAHERIAEEITGHLIDGRDGYLSEGLDESAATEKAIKESGDAAWIGMQLDRVHRPKSQWSMIVMVLTLFLLGVLVRGYVYEDMDIRSIAAVSRKSMFYGGIGIIGMLGAYYADFTILGSYPRRLFFGFIPLAVILSKISPHINGRPIYARYIILLFPLIFSMILFLERNKGIIGVMKCILAFMLLSVLGFLIDTASGILHFVMAGIILMGIAGLGGWFGNRRMRVILIMIIPAVLTVVSYVCLMGDYGWARLTHAFRPELDPTGSGFFSILTRGLLETANLSGTGNIPSEYGTDFLKPGFFPTDDSLLTILIVNRGWGAFLLIMTLVLIFMIKGFIRCFRQKSSLGFIVSLAVMLTFTVQTITYVTYNMGFQLIAPVSLPLIISGNAALIVNMILIGFMLSVFRIGGAVKEKSDPNAERSGKKVEWGDGKVTIYFTSWCPLKKIKKLFLYGRQ